MLLSAALAFDAVAHDAVQAPSAAARQLGITRATLLYRARRPPLTFVRDHYTDYEAPRLVVERILCRCRHLVVQGVDRGPEGRQVEDRRRRGSRANDLERGGSGLLARSVDDRDAPIVDEVVDDDRRDDLVSQRMSRDARREALAQERREVIHGVSRKPRVCGQSRAVEVTRERDLGVGRENRELG